jgi:subtilisin family serine protease
MEQLRDQVSKEMSWYTAWHEKPRAGMVHWTALLLIASLLTWNVTTIIASTNGKGAIPSEPSSLATVIGGLDSVGALNKKIPDQYIIAFKQSVQAGDVPGLARQLSGQSDGTLLYTYTSALKGFAARIPSQAVNGLRNNPNIEYIEADSMVEISVNQNNPTWGLDRVDQRNLPLNQVYSYNTTGNGVTAYIIDTGINYSHVDFEGRAEPGYDFEGRDGSDCHSHGTHVAGTVGGKTYGVAKGVKLVSIRTMRCDGSGSTSGVVAGLDWMVKNGSKPGVVNMSIGGSSSLSMDTAMRAAINAGFVIVAAAGNQGDDACNYSPPRVEEAITVGSTMTDDSKRLTSNYGSCVDLFAPGTSIVSASYSSNTGTATKSGTSMAAPHVAGAVALYLEGNRTATPAQVFEAIYAQASKNVVKNSNTANNHMLYTLTGSESVSTPTNNPPTAQFSSTCFDYQCSFSDLSVDSEGPISSWQWSFGNGSNSSDRHPNHTYTSAGNYQVNLVVTDSGALSSSVAKTVQVIEPAKISLVATTSKVKSNVSVTLTWAGAQTSTVDIYRNGIKITTVANSGTYVDNRGKGKDSTTYYPYKVCESGTGECSHSTYQN